MSALLHGLLQYMLANQLEAAGMLATLVGIALTTRRLMVCWPIVLLADLLYLVVFFRAQLYSDALLQIFFLCFTLYGWWYWARGVRDDGAVRVVPLSLRAGLSGLAAGAVGACALGWMMNRIGAALPHLDAALTAFSLVASLWQARKHTANWILWIAADLVYVGEYIYKGLYLTALLYALLVLLAMEGLRDWSHGPQQTQKMQAAD